MGRADCVTVNAGRLLNVYSNLDSNHYKITCVRSKSRALLGAELLSDLAALFAEIKGSQNANSHK